MYLKSIDIIGFKSFADKTSLTLEPGITAIVGPNGCGKSNVSDALRWVLGEQSAKALRGAKMEDCIFNGTQNRKPLGMAEVNITFADCEGVLQTEFHEVTVARRVFRSGEGQYFINRTPCRLKDIQRLFMDTGIGTTSYSFMAQGQIDQILSARPEDRRAIFEEASGITKYKTDRREAMRKLEHTEANLVRLADVIREVKRQIGSLQRQAGKARRFKNLKDELRMLDLYATRHRLRSIQEQIKTTQAGIEALVRELHVAHAGVDELEGRNTALHENMIASERQIASATEAALEAQGKLDRTHDLIRMNRQRIEEYREWSARDTREAEDLNRQITEQRGQVETLAHEIEVGQKSGATLENALREAKERHDRLRDRIQALQDGIQRQREKANDLDALGNRLQNQLVDLENRERSTIIQRERLAAEKAGLARQKDDLDARRGELKSDLERLRAAAYAATGQLDTLQTRHEKMDEEQGNRRQQRAARLSEMAAQEARLEMLTAADTVKGDYPSGAQRLLDNPVDSPLEPSELVGPIAGLIDIDPTLDRALETALRMVIDAVVTRTDTALRKALADLAGRRTGPARLLVAEGLPDAEPVQGAAPRLIDHCTCASGMEPLMRRLLGHVFLAENIDSIPAEIPAGATFVTSDGIAISGNGHGEFWMPVAGETNPLARKHAIAAVQREIARLDAEIAGLDDAIAAGLQAIEKNRADLAAARQAHETAQRVTAQKEGEEQLVVREVAETAKRFERSAVELEQLTTRSRSWDAEKAAISERQKQVRADREQVFETSAEQTRELRQLESQLPALQNDLTEKRIATANATQRHDHMAVQLQGAHHRVAQLEAALQGRSNGIESYQTGIRKLADEIAEATTSIAGIEAALTQHGAEATRLRNAREAVARRLKEQEAELAQQRSALEAAQQHKSELDVRAAELRMRNENIIERVTGEYHLSLEDVLAGDDPDFPDAKPTCEEAEAQVADLRARIEAMGPVNLVAIEEYREHEERYTFLAKQEEDLINARRQLTDMIQKINKTTAELFRETFDRTNRNFQSMFGRLFNGGEARLVLIDEADILECGIDIIARPPGKRLQNISLLSGGERTLTAVALLFAIYLIKPSPFCLLDELDAPLDDSNIGRFIAVLKEFQQQSQFMIITHNRQTIAAADIIYGVTMPEKGVSSIVSMRFRSAEGGVEMVEEQER